MPASWRLVGSVPNATEPVKASFGAFGGKLLGVPLPSGRCRRYRIAAEPNMGRIVGRRLSATAGVLPGGCPRPMVVVCCLPPQGFQVILMFRVECRFRLGCGFFCPIRVCGLRAAEFLDGLGEPIRHKMRVSLGRRGRSLCSRLRPPYHGTVRSGSCCSRLEGRHELVRHPLRGSIRSTIRMNLNPS